MEGWHSVQPSRPQIGQPAKDVAICAIRACDASAEKERREQRPFEGLPIVEGSDANRAVLWRKIEPDLSLVGRDHEVADVSPAPVSDWPVVAEVRKMIAGESGCTFHLARSRHRPTQTWRASRLPKISKVPSFP